jgi:hypothetical protein
VYRPCHICTGTGLTPPTSAPGLGSLLSPSAPGPRWPRPHVRQDWAHPRPHLRRDCATWRSWFSSWRGWWRACRTRSAPTQGARPPIDSPHCSRHARSLLRPEPPKSRTRRRYKQPGAILDIYLYTYIYIYVYIHICIITGVRCTTDAGRAMPHALKGARKGAPACARASMPGRGHALGRGRVRVCLRLWRQRVRGRESVRACVYARARVCLRERVNACVCVCVCMCACVRV